MNVLGRGPARFILAALFGLAVGGCTSQAGDKADDDGRGGAADLIEGRDDGPQAGDQPRLGPDGGRPAEDLRVDDSPGDQVVPGDIQSPPDKRGPDDVPTLPGDQTQPEELSTDAAPPPDAALPDLVDASSKEMVVEPDIGGWTDLGDAASLTDGPETPADSLAEEEAAAAPDNLEAPDIPPEEQKNARAQASAEIVRKAKYQEYLYVQCAAVDGYGQKIEDPGAWEVQVSAPDVEEAEGGYLFPTPGTYTITCLDEANDLSASVEVVVAHELLSPTIPAVSRELATQAELIPAALDAAANDDLEALGDCLQGLAETRNTIATAIPGVTQVPPGGWPSLGEIQGKVPAEPDDDGYVLAVAAVTLAAQELLAATQALQTAPSLQSLYTLEVATQAAQEALAGTVDLNPGGVGLFKAMPEWDAALEAVRQAQDAYSNLVEEMLNNPEDFADEPCPGCFTLTEVMVSISINYILSQIPSYQGMLKEAGKAAASMALMMAISDAIDDAFPPGPGAPEIQYNMPGYGNAVNDGSALSLLVVGFDEYPGNNAVLFIGPSVADTAVNVVDLALGSIKAIKDLDSWDNVFELGGAIVGAFNQMQDNLGLLSNDIPGLLKTGVVTMPVLSVDKFMGPGNGMWDYIVNLPALPEVNDGWLPKVGLLIPITFSKGNGPSYKLVILP